ncbi:hypothetical protein, conserved [Babesia bigemina]|uniref:Uncharacterized protein n=1 Tax=Babesia bigemina TaxID=5866 RepID=A0A061DBM2_BABBI|nr:hypothetical protein, conserved [Babesia bigemina]CDR97958.1 hypothetical protein, conserved [Babesia bigemina]|eukprot:XP_012770144.1 hypothetical protein, conserved [Babesia bigemina]
MQGMYSFFNEPYDFQLVLGITLVGIPELWDGEDLLRYLRTYSFMFGDELALGFCGVSLMEATSEEPRRAHLICDNLITKQRCLQMRVMPIVVADDEVPGPYPCVIVAIRPYCFWVRRTRDSPVLPFMFPKYTSREVVGEEFEAKMLLMPNNQRLLVVATMIGAGIIPTAAAPGGPTTSFGSTTLAFAVPLHLSLFVVKIVPVVYPFHRVALFHPLVDRRHLDVSSVLQLWLTELSGSRAQLLTDQLSHLHRAISNFSPHRLGVSDDLIYAADYRELFSWTWPWNPCVSEQEIERPCRSLQEHGGEGGAPIQFARIKRGARHTGCIRYEHNRKRWVVDLSVNGCRMQKCFHENLYGMVGGLQAARKWRLDYIRNTHNEFDIEAEERIVNDLVDKIVAMDDLQRDGLLCALRKPVPTYEHILGARSLCDIVDGRLAAIGHYKP